MGDDNSTNITINVEGSDDQPATLAHIRAIHKRLDEGQGRMVTMQTELSRNSEITEDIRGIMRTAEAGFKVLAGLGVAAKWIGGIAFAISTCWGLFYAWTHGGSPPLPK